MTKYVKNYQNLLLSNQVNLNSSIKKIVINNNKVEGVLNNQGEFIKADSVVVTYPAYIAVKQFLMKIL